jgi:hypothetical protein
MTLHSIKGNCRTPKAKARRRVVGAGTAIGAFLAFGMTPLATAPNAHADFDFVDMIDSFLGDAADTGSGGGSAFDLGDLGGSSDFGAQIATAFQTDFYLPLHSALESSSTATSASRSTA